MRIVIELETGNDAFNEDDPDFTNALARVLEQASAKVLERYVALSTGKDLTRKEVENTHFLRDVNGNRIGKVHLRL